MEGLASSFMFTLGGLGFIVLDQTHTSGIPKLNRTMLQVTVQEIAVIKKIAICTG